MKLINIKADDEDSKLLLKCYIISLFIPDIQKVVLMLLGSQGSAKSSLQDLIKMLVDPSQITTLTFPRDTNEFLQQLSHHHVTYYDNISTIKEWVSDLLCRAVTGTGSSKRQLYTDDDDIIRNFKRCVGFNGINLGATKADLLDRGLIIKLEEISKSSRRKPSDIWNEFEQIRPKLLGYIFDTLVQVLDWKKNGGSLNLRGLPRMAEFAEYGEIISRCMGHKDNQFIDAYYKNIELQSEEVIESSLVAATVIQLVNSRDKGWEGTPTQLLSDLEEKAVLLNINIKSRSWPKAPNSLSKRLNEIKVNLKQINIEIEGSQDKQKRRTITIRKLSSEPSPSSETGNQAQKHARSGDDTSTFSTVSSEVSSPNICQNHAQIDTGDGGDDRDDTIQASVADGVKQELEPTCQHCGEKIDPDLFYRKIHLQNCKLETERKLEEQSHKANIRYGKHILHNSVIPRSLK